jgi:hypothetical protein
LEIAAILSENFQVSFGTRQCPSDLFIEADAMKIAVECKRPSGNPKKCIKDGFSQLRDRYPKGASRGILVVSCSRLIGASHAGIKALNAGHLDELCLQGAREINRLITTALPDSKSPLTIGLVLHFRIMGFLQDPAMPWMHQTLIANSLRELDSVEKGIMDTIVSG